MEVKGRSWTRKRRKGKTKDEKSVRRFGRREIYGRSGKEFQRIKISTQERRKENVREETKGDKEWREYWKEKRESEEESEKPRP